MFFNYIASTDLQIERDRRFQRIMTLPPLFCHIEMAWLVIWELGVILQCITLFRRQSPPILNPPLVDMTPLEDSPPPVDRFRSRRCISAPAVLDAKRIKLRNQQRAMHQAIVEEDE